MTPDSYVAAYEALISGRFADCIALCEQVLRDAAAPPLVRAHACSWAAIATYGVSRDSVRARELFQQAVALAPDDRGALDNLAVADGLVRDPATTIPDFAIARPLR